MKGGHRKTMDSPQKTTAARFTGCVTGSAWTPDEDAVLRECAGGPSKKIAVRLAKECGSQRSPGAITRRTYVLRERGIIPPVDEVEVEPDERPLRRKRVNAIRVGSRSFRISWDPDLLNEAALVAPDAPGEHAYGYCGRVDRVIVLDPEMHSTAESVLETVLHEALHAGEGLIGVEIPHAVLNAIGNIVVAILIQSGFVEPEDYIIGGRDLKEFQP